MFGRYAESILAYVALELTDKRVKEARSIFRKFHRRQLQENGGAVVCEAWLRFEREHGSADDHFQAVLKTQPVLSQALAAATAAANPEAAAESRVSLSGCMALPEQEGTCRTAHSEVSIRKEVVRLYKGHAMWYVSYKFQR